MHEKLGVGKEGLVKYGLKTVAGCSLLINGISSNEEPGTSNQ